MMASATAAGARLAAGAAWRLLTGGASGTIFLRLSARAPHRAPRVLEATAPRTGSFATLSRINLGLYLAQTTHQGQAPWARLGGAPTRRRLRSTAKPLIFVRQGAR